MIHQNPQPALDGQRDPSCRPPSHPAAAALTGSRRRWCGLVRLLLLLCVPLWANAETGDREAVYGIWASSGSMIEVRPTEGGSLSARIIALKHPNWREKDRAGVVGEPRTDYHNPDAALRERPLLGLEVLSGFRYERGLWRGRLYVPSNGSTWRSTLRVKDGELFVRGFLGISLLGRTERFAPLEACNEDILRMIAAADLRDTPCDDELETGEQAP